MDFSDLPTIADPRRRHVAIRARAEIVHQEFLKKPPVRALHSFDLLSIPFPLDYVRWGQLFAAPKAWRSFRALHPAQGYLDFRMLVIEDAGGARILVHPLWIESTRSHLLERFGDRVQIHRPMTVRLDQIGLRPEEVDFVVLHHLHFQVLRPLVELFPRARFVVQEMELAWSRHLHPLDALFYVPGGADIDLPGVRGGMEIGESLRVIPTPGCTPGHQTLIARLPEGVATFSANGVAVDNYYLEGQEANLQEVEVLPSWSTSWSPQGQYDSMLLEKCVASPYMTYTSTALSGSRRMKVEVGRLPLPEIRKFTPRLRIGSFPSTMPSLEESEESLIGA